MEVHPACLLHGLDDFLYLGFSENRLDLRVFVDCFHDGVVLHFLFLCFLLFICDICEVIAHEIAELH